MTTNLLCRFWAHKFSNWEYVADGSCDQIQVCKRCGYEQWRNDTHQFSDWEYSKLEKSEWEQRGGYYIELICNAKRVCRRCDYVERSKGHEWEEISSGPEEHVGADIVKGFPVDYYSREVVYQCTRCKEREKKTESTTR